MMGWLAASPARQQVPHHHPAVLQRGGVRALWAGWSSDGRVPGQSRVEWFDDNGGCEVRIFTGSLAGR